jgi:hypothetical protein
MKTSATTPCEAIAKVNAENAKKFHIFSPFFFIFYNKSMIKSHQA